MIKILLVDDEYHVIHHISNLLEQIQFCEINILTTTSGLEALKIAESSHIDIAFLDINMPQTNGLQIAYKLHQQWPDCQLIFLTAYEVFDYIYETNQYPGSIYLLKAESDARILEVATTCCQSILTQRKEKRQLSDVQKREHLLLLLQEQYFLREIIQENLTCDLKRLVNSAALDIPFSFDHDVYVMLMHIRRAPSYCNHSFYLEEMTPLLENQFFFSFVETEKNFFLWIFQPKEASHDENSSFHYLKDALDSFLDTCSEIKHQTLTLCLYRKQTAWKQLARTYQLLYDSYYEENTMLTAHSSVARIVKKNIHTEDSPISQASSIPASEDPASRLAVMKQALYQGDDGQFFAELQHCRQYCLSARSMHHVGAIKIYFSIVLIYLDYIGHYMLESKIAMEIALYPLYFINDFPDWERAFSYLKQLGTILFKIASENNKDKTKELISTIQNYIQRHLSENLNLTVIANYVNYNESHISRLFKRCTGSNLSEYINSCRIEYAKTLLTQTNDTIQVISQKAGFHTSQYFSSSFRRVTGLPPNEYRNRKRTES